MSTSGPTISRKRGLTRLIILFALLAFGANLLYSASSKSSSGHLPEVAKPDTETMTTGGKQGPLAKINKDIFHPNTLLPLLMLQAVPPESVATYDGATCTVPKTTFVLGDAVCAKVSGATPSQRSVTWITPDYRNSADGLYSPGIIVERDDLPPSSQVTFTLPTTDTSTIDGTTVDNRGTWRVNLVPRGRYTVRATVTFTVTDPQQPAVDLSVYNFNQNSSGQVPAGGNLAVKLFVGNNGPDAAQSVVVTQQVPSNTTFLSETQSGGLPFVCTNPTIGETGTTTCTIATLPKDSTAEFTFVYKVDASAPQGTVLSTTANATSDPPSNESNANNNTWTARAVVSGNANSTTSCTLSCPADITQPADTTNDDNVRGAVVHYPSPSGNTECGTIATDHCNDCFFPVGTTVVTASADTGDTCSFNVTVTDPNAPTISCPANKEVNADSNCEANVAVGTPTATGNNVTISATRSDGKPMYNCDSNGANCTRQVPDYPFPAGVNTITWTATSHDGQGNETGNASCTQTITVDDVTPPTITPPPGQTVSADENCQATVPDFTASTTVSDNCACASSDNSESCVDRQRITVTQSPAAGTVVGTGSHTITLTANDGSSNNSGAGNSSTATTTFTVNDTTAPTISCPANITVNEEPGTCAAHVSPGTPTASDNCGTPTVSGSRSDGKPLTDPYPVGTTTITWTATDGAGNHSSCTQTITVVDNTPPVITLNGQTITLWPPNHKYQTVNVTNLVASASDDCDTSVNIGKVVISKVTSDEIENGNGDGNTLNDIIIASNCKSVQLRSERDGDGNGRVYTITFKVTDAAGNVTTATAKVTVPKNQNGSAAIDSGVHYTVNGTCP